jgi:Fe-S cluster assembly ATP-binding protein
MLCINDLHVEVENKKILNGVNLEIPDNEVHSLFGPNGSGKSVLISTIMGYPEFNITQGQILYNNVNINDLDIHERVSLGIGISEQRPPTIKGLKLRNLMDLLSQDKKHTDELISKYKLEPFLDRNINDGLSGGEIKKSELFLTLLSHPSFLILDEPDSGVDPEHLKKISEMINEALQRDKAGSLQNSRRNSGLIATHSASILEYVQTDKAHIMLNGKICCSGNPLIMMNQIRTQGYSFCITCQQTNSEDYENTKY